MVEDRDDSPRRRRARRCAAGAWKRASRRSGTRRWRWSRCADAGAARRCIPAMVRAAEWLLGEEVTDARRLVGRATASSRPAAGRSSSPTSTTPTSTTPPRSCSRCARVRARADTRPRPNGSAARASLAARIDGASAGCGWVEGMQSSRRRLGRVRRRQHARARARAAVPGLRRGDRRAERRRDRARGRDARRARARATRPPPGAACAG